MSVFGELSLIYVFKSLWTWRLRPRPSPPLPAGVAAGGTEYYLVFQSGCHPEMLASSHCGRVESLASAVVLKHKFDGAKIHLRLLVSVCV